MNGRRLWGAAALVLLLPACSTTSSDSSGASDALDDSITLTSAPLEAAEGAKKLTPRSTFKGAKKARKVALRALPQIIHPGKKTAKAGKARVGLVVQVQPRRQTVVTLQVRSGNQWKALRHASTNKSGHVVLAAAPRHGGAAAQYRVKVGKTISPVRSTAAWLKPSLNENFDGKKLSKHWNHRGPGYNPTGLRECSKGDPRAVKVTGGRVRISVRKDPDRKGKCVGKKDGVSTGKYAWRLNGHISTEETYNFQYGFAAARIKFPAKRGQHSAFWMQPKSPDFSTNPFDSSKAGAEVDIIEAFGRGAGTQDSLGLTTFTYHYTKPRGTGPLQQVKTGSWLKNSQRFMAGKKADPYNRYHVYSVEWTPKQYIFRIDGKVSWRSKVGVSATPQFLILSNLSSDYELRRLGGDKKLPAHLNVDWVRVWETGK